MTEGQASADVDELVRTLRKMEEAQVTTVQFSMPWDWLQQEEQRIRYDYVSWVVESACENTNLKVALVLDLARAPQWLFAKYPDARSKDSHGRSYELLSWSHEEANKAALGFLGDIAGHLAQTHRGCVTAMQPVYNNEYQAKYTQEFDAYQDYAPVALSAYRQWLQARSSKPRLEDVNARWGTEFKAWEEVVPPALEAGSKMGIDLSPRFWDWIHFREAHGARVLNRACAAVQAAGLRCFHQLPDTFTVLNAVYGATMLQQLAASPHTDFLVLGTNFRTPFGTGVNPAKIRLAVAAAQSYGKPVHFMASVNQVRDLELLAEAYRQALLAGAEGLGLSNWAGRLQWDEALSAAMRPGLERAGTGGCRVRGKGQELVGVFIDLGSCSAWHGLQWQWSRKDPLHDFVQDLADTLGATCEADVSVYLALDRFVEAVPLFDRIVFVEPLVLHGAAQVNLYALAKAATLSKRHEVMQLPANQTNGVLMGVLQQL